MRRVTASVLLALGPLVVAVAGFLWGRLERAPGPSLGQLAFLAGGLLGIAGLFRREGHAREPRGGQLTAACLIAYLVIAGVVEPFAFVLDSDDWVFVSVAWLSPLIVGGVLLPGRGSWLAGMGCWAVLFSGTTALGYNVGHVDSGMGFLFCWLA